MSTIEQRTWKDRGMTVFAWVAAVAFSWVALVPGPVWAQTAGAIAGVARDSSGAVLPGVTVEASSPALIEGVRSGVTDGQGNYKLVELRPGTYTVTFTLAGFSTFRREGIEITTGFTATTNAELAVGALEETVTVAGVSPIVDTQNARTQYVLTEEVLNSVPTGKMTNGFLALTLGAIQAGQAGLDVGGSRAEASTHILIHGSRGGDLKRQIDGMSFNMLAGHGGGQNVTFRVSSVGIQETVMQGNATAESETTGAINYIPKDGGNQFSMVGTAAFSNDNFQGDNLDDKLRARGAFSPASVKRVWDYGLGIGGPILRDKLWFYSANRAWGSHNAPPGAYYNATQSTVGPYVYTPDLSRPAFEDQYNREFSGRFTWQVAEKHKVSLAHHFNQNCNCFERVSSRLTPAASDSPTNRNNFNQTTWTYPATNRLLLTAGASFGFFPITIPFHPGVTADHIAITELSTGVQFNARAPGFNYSVVHYGEGFSNNFTQRFAVTYVTGSHAFKVGMGTQQGHYVHDAFTNKGLKYSLFNGAPVSLTQHITPFHWDLRFTNFSMYVQDQWTTNKLTLNYGVRYDQHKGGAPADRFEAGIFSPAIDFPEVKNIADFKDISPRVSASYDIFGDGRTAIKASVGRYVVGHATDRTQNQSPVFEIAQRTSRTWNDANGDFEPDCVLTDQSANGECGAINNLAFGTRVPIRSFDDNVQRGWGNRVYNWQTSVVFEHELRPGLGMTVGYYRTSFKNLFVRDNHTLVPGDFDEYCVTSPLDARLPGGGNQELCGLYDLNPSRFGLPPDTFETQSESFPGDHFERFNGVDIKLSGRFENGALLTGGVATGSQATYNCKIIDSPEGGRPGFCGNSQPWSAGTQIKLNGSYPLPWGGVQVSGVYQNLPGQPVGATFVATNAQIAPSLGRNLSGCPAVGACSASRTVAIVQPQTMFEDRTTQLDLRVTKVFVLGTARLKAMFDVYNVTNDNAVTLANGRYGGAWLTPLRFHGPRLFKFGVEVNY